MVTFLLYLLIMFLGLQGFGLLPNVEELAVPTPFGTLEFVNILVLILYAMVIFQLNRENFKASDNFRKALYVLYAMLIFEFIRNIAMGGELRTRASRCEADLHVLAPPSAVGFA